MTAVLYVCLKSRLKKRTLRVNHGSDYVSTLASTLVNTKEKCACGRASCVTYSLGMESLVVMNNGLKSEPINLNLMALFFSSLYMSPLLSSVCPILFM